MSVPNQNNQVSEKKRVSFVCQRCRQPLKIDLSFDTIEQQRELVKELTATLKKRKGTLKALENDIIWALSEVSKSNFHTEEESDTLKESERDLATPLVNSDTDDKVFSDTDISKDQNQGSNFHTEEESDTLKESERDLATPLVNSDTDDKVFSDTDISKDQNQGSNLHTEEESDTLKEGEQYLATPLINSDTDDKVFSDTDISKDQNQGSSLHTYEESDTLTESEQYLSTLVVISETEDQAISDTDLPEDSNNRFSSDYDNDDSLDEDYNPSGSESDEDWPPALDCDCKKCEEKPLPIGKFDEDELISRHTVLPRHLDSIDGNDFTLLGDTGPASLGNLGHKPKIQAVLFDIMTGQSSVDHPLCEECTDSLLNQLDDQLKITEEECKDYRNFLERLETNTDDDDDIALDEELKQLKAEEETLRQELQKVELEQSVIEAEILKEKETTKKLEEEEERYWREYNEYKRQVQELDDEQKSVDNQLKYAQAQLDKLKKTNVFNSTFHIWHSGHFGTINNFRLGRLPSDPVEWNEINAAWGQTVLLLHSLARKMNLTFQRYKLVPYGNSSYLESLTDKSKQLPLYVSGGLRFYWDTKFDQAMVAFLDCLQQFKEEVEKGDSQFCLPYKMEKGKIEDTSTNVSYSIKIQFNSEEQWTKALKFMLTNLKWGLAWVSSQFANK